MRIVFILAGLAALAAPQVATPQAGQPLIEVWYELVGPKGQLIGILHEWVRPGPGGTERGRRRMLAYQVAGHTATRSTTSLIRHYDHAGHLTSFEAESLTPQARAQTRGAVNGAQLSLESFSDGKRRNRVIALPPGLVLGEPLLLHAPAPSSQLSTFADIVPGSLGLTNVVAELRGPPARALRIARADGRVISADVIERDEAGAVSRLIQPLLGYDLVLRRVAGPIDSASLSASRDLPHEMRPSPFFIRPHALTGQIRYRFGWRSGFNGTLPETGEQAATAKDGEWQLDICKLCGPAVTPSPAELEQWRKPTRWIDSDAPEFRATVRRGKGTDAARMATLSTIARTRLAVTDFEGHVSARTAWRRGAGDCTEDAVVLAALARAAGIPARVASGLVYSRQRYHGAANAFLPHSWVIAWIDGRWRSYDISLEGFDASHLALNLSDGEPSALIEANRLAAMLDWKAMGEVRRD